MQDLNDDFDGQIFADVLVPQTESLGPEGLGLEFSVPMFVFQGEEDFRTPTALARQHIDSMKAPCKEFVSITGAFRDVHALGPVFTGARQARSPLGRQPLSLELMTASIR